MKEGDIYHWQYREEGDDRQYGRYHCCSRIAVVRNGRLRDTFWSPGSNGRSFAPGDLAKLELTYIANFADLEKAGEHLAVYYDDADIVDLNHSNSSRGNFYLRKGAKRSAEKMLEVARYKLGDAQERCRAAENEIERLLCVIEEIESGKLDVYV